MTINMMTFENTFLILDSTIKAGSFTQYLKCIAAIVKHKYNNNMLYYIIDVRKSWTLEET